MSVVHYSAIMKTQMTQLYFNPISHLRLQFVVHNPFIDWSPFVSWLTAADNCWQIAFNAPSTGKNGIDSVGIDSCANRLGVSLVSV